MSEEIDTESKLIWKIIIHTILSPFKFILALFGKAEFGSVFQPITDIFKFLAQSKFTVFIIVLNLIMFILQIIFGENFSYYLASYPNDILHLNRIFSLISSGFIHANLAHLLGNMLVLLIFGRAVERKLGIGKTFIVYFSALIISGIFDNLINIYFGLNEPGLGASGAIMGLIAVGMLISPLQLTYLMIIPVPLMIIAWISIIADITGVLTGVKDNIGHYAHIGGFLSVTLMYFFFGQEDKSKLRKGFIINLVSIAISGAIYYLFLKKF